MDKTSKGGAKFPPAIVWIRLILSCSLHPLKTAPLKIFTFLAQHICQTAVGTSIGLLQPHLAGHLIFSLAARV